jgi:hypothetical protein
MISDGRKEHDLSEVDIEDRWKIIQKIIKDNAEVVLGSRQNRVRNEWFDEECRKNSKREITQELKYYKGIQDQVWKSTKKKGELQIVCAKIKRGNEKTENYFEEHQSCKYYKEVKM